MRVGERKKYTVKRPMVLLLMQLGSEQKMIEVNLANREHFIYPLLLGRTAIISFNVMIDPSKVFLAKVCTKDVKKYEA